MNTRTHLSLHRTAAAALLATLLAACGESSPQVVPEPVPPPVESSPAAPAQPASEVPPPVDPSAASSPMVLARAPALETMASAGAPAKLSVPVDLKYHFDSDPLTNQPAILHLAAVPRVAGSNLTISMKPARGVQIAAGGALNVQKASANGAYRQQFSVTRQAEAPAELRVLVTMDLPEGSTFGFFSVPLAPGKISQIPDSVKRD
jgi:hypothetical protein